MRLAFAPCMAFARFTGFFSALFAPWATAQRIGAVVLIHSAFAVLFSTAHAGPVSRVAGVIRGMEARFAAVVRIGHEDPARGNAFCTATWVGPRALVTAAHCMGASTRVRMQAGVEEGVPRFIGGTIHRHPLYHGYSAQREHAIFDVAVIEADEPDPGVRPWEVGDVAPEVDSVISFVGYGCAQYGGKYDRVSRFGSAPLESVEDGMFYATADSRRFRGRLGREWSAACLGDSGGPALMVGASGAGAYKTIGVASGLGLDETKSRAVGSRFHDLTHERSRAFLRDVAERRGLEIFGISQTRPRDG